MTRWVRLSERTRGALSPRVIRWHEARADNPELTACGIVLDPADVVESYETEPSGYTVCGLCRAVQARRQIYIEHWANRRGETQ